MIPRHIQELSIDGYESRSTHSDNSSDDDSTMDTSNIDNRDSLELSQVVPLLLSSDAEEVDCYSVYAAQHAISRRVLIKRHPYDMAFAITDYKLQARTLPKLILSICKRKRMPWMSLQAFYVLISRVTSMSGLRLLQYDKLGLQSVGKQMPDMYLYAWERGYNPDGIWNGELAANALRNIRNARLNDRKAMAKNISDQPLDDKQRSPIKKRQSEAQCSSRKSSHTRRQLFH